MTFVRSSLGFAGLVLSSAGLAAQLGSEANAPLLAKFDPAGQSFNDIWGYTSPSGGEYALLGSTRGTYVVDCTDPSNPVQRAFFSGPNSAWRDIRTYQNYAYVVTEGGGGCQIIDLSDPDNPNLLGTWGNQFWSNTHNVAIDTDAGVLYACGTNSGTQIVDLTGDPTNPTLIGNYFAAYVHDLHVQDGWAHLGEFNSSRYRILDVSDPGNWQIVGNAPSQACHNAWPTRDNNFAVTTAEKSAGRLRVFNIQDKSNPVEIARWRTGGAFSSIHNAYVRDRVVHAAYYSEGYRAVDLSNPAVPKSIAKYDTHVSTGGYSGAWGCYPFMKSGTIYISDRDNGLHLLDSQAAACVFGDGSAGTVGVPDLRPFGAAYFGNSTFAFEVDNVPAGAQVSLIISTGSTSLNVQGLELLVDLAAPHLVTSMASDSSGAAKFDMPLAIGLPETILYAQALVVDPAGPLGLASSPALKVDFFKRGIDL